MRQLLLLSIFSLSLLKGEPIDIKQIPMKSESWIIAIDVQVNPSNMKPEHLWEPPILLLYKQVENFNNLRPAQIRSELMAEFEAGTYQPVVLRARQGSDYTAHFKNLIGLDDPPVRLVQGRICKGCDERVYTFSYGPNAVESQFPFKASIHAHGVSYTIDNDGTNVGLNIANDPSNYGLISPGETRTYHYQNLDYPGIWPMHDHAHPSHTMGRGLHMVLVVEEKEQKIIPDHDFLIIFSDYPNYNDYLDEFYNETGVPPFLHMKNGNVMHAHALNGYAAMVPPRMMMAMQNGGTRWDAMRTDIISEPRTPVFEVDLGDLIRFRLISFGSATTHTFHLHGHVWYDKASQRHIDNVIIPASSSYDIMLTAGGGPFNPGAKIDPTREKIRSGPGDWLYHCHIIPHVKHGMWGIFRVNDTRSNSESDK